MLYKDKVGNKAYFEGQKLAVRNREGKLVNKEDTKRFIKKHAAEIKKKTGWEIQAVKKKKDPFSIFG